MAVLLSLTGKQQLLAWFNRDNTQNFDFSQIQFSVPEALAVPPGERNARVTVTALPGQPASGSDVIRYYRHDISDVIPPEYRIIYVPVEVDSTWDLIPYINEQLGIQLLQEDVIDEPVDNETLPVTFTLRMTPVAYGYIGTVPMTISAQLSDLITVKALTGLQLPMDPVFEVGTAEVTDAGSLFSGTGILTSKLLCANNGELEIVLGAHRRSSGQVGEQLMFDPVDGNYSFTVENTKHWSWSFQLGLRDTSRSDNLLDLYQVSMTVEYMGGVAPFTLYYNDTVGVERLSWDIGNANHILDSEPAGRNDVTGNSQQVRWYANYFTNPVVNSAGAYLGEFVITVTATPRHVVVKPITLSTTVTVTAA